ncbi:MAG: hypothetical protein QXK84_06675 [Nitrososphaerota archaeon]
MRQITDIVDALVRRLREATGLRVKTAWIAVGDVAPLITLLMHDSEIRPIDMSGRLIYDLRFQIDIWHQSAKARDEVFDRILAYFDQNKSALHNDYGWFDVRFTGLTDLEEEGVFRKIVMLRLRVVG